MQHVGYKSNKMQFYVSDLNCDLYTHATWLCSYHISMKHAAPDKAVGIRVNHHQDVSPWATQGDISVAVVWAIIITSSGIAWRRSLQNSRTAMQIHNITALKCISTVCFSCIVTIKIIYMINAYNRCWTNILWYPWTAVFCICKGRGVCVPQFKVNHQHLYPI
jgi:hypothetical protein